QCRQRTTQRLKVMPLRYVKLQNHNRDQDRNHTVAERFKPAFAHILVYSAPTSTFIPRRRSSGSIGSREMTSSGVHTQGLSILPPAINWAAMDRGHAVSMSPALAFQSRLDRTRQSIVTAEIPRRPPTMPRTTTRVTSKSLGLSRSVLSA